MFKISEVTRENQNIATLTLLPEGTDDNLIWTPGQFVRISVLQDNKWSDAHTFTISSCPEDTKVQITIKVYGEFTRSLYNAKVGETVTVSGPFGSFCKDCSSKDNITFIAGGIGITPFLSVLRHLNYVKAHNKITLFWANNEMFDIFCTKELSELTKTLNLKVIHVVWKDGPGVENCTEEKKVVCLKGFLDSTVFTNHQDLERSDIYLCGPPKMNEHVKNVLESMKYISLNTETMFSTRRENA